MKLTKFPLFVVNWSCKIHNSTELVFASLLEGLPRFFSPQRLRVHDIHFSLFCEIMVEINTCVYLYGHIYSAEQIFDWKRIKNAKNKLFSRLHVLVCFQGTQKMYLNNCYVGSTHGLTYSRWPILSKDKDKLELVRMVYIVQSSRRSLANCQKIQYIRTQI